MIKALLKANGVDTSQTITPLPLDRSNSVKRKQSASSSRTSRSSEGTRPKAPEIVLDSGDPRVNDCRTLLLQDVEAGYAALLQISDPIFMLTLTAVLMKRRKRKLGRLL